MKDSVATATQIDFPDVRIELGELIQPEKDQNEDDCYDDKDFENDDGEVDRDWRQSEPTFKAKK